MEKDHEHKELQPQRGEYQATVKESTDLLKKLAEFNSKKEEVLKRISSIGARMEERLGPLGAAASAANDTSSFKENAMPEFLKTHVTHMPDPFTKIAYTRTRETQKPIFVQGCFNVAFPSKKALTSEWMTLASDGKDASFEVMEDGVHLQAGGKMVISTGIRLALPQDLALYFTSNKDLSVVSPTLFTSQFKEDELTITVKNITDTTTVLLFDIPLFTGYPIHLVNNITCDELLNSTYEDWVHGTING